MLRMSLVVLVGCSGCFWVVQGSYDEVGLYSEPSGVEVTVRSGRGQVDQRVTTPGVVRVERCDWPVQVTFEREGYAACAAEVHAIPGHRVKGMAYVGGVFDTLLIVPVIVDALSGVYNGWPYEVRAVMAEEGRGGSTVDVVWSARTPERYLTEEEKTERGEEAKRVEDERAERDAFRREHGW